MTSEEIYYYVGFAFTWVTVFTGSLIILSKLLTYLIDKLGNIFTNWWVIVDYAYYRKEFKEFMKDKKSITEHKRNKKY